MKFKNKSITVYHIQATVCLMTSCLISIGCGSGNDSKTKSEGPAYDGSKFLAKSDITGATEVTEARESVKNSDDIIIVGRIGGSLDPWVAGRAAFSIVDRSLKSCIDGTPEGESCSCQTPWDYCCETDKLKDAMALVKFVENNGKVVDHDARKIFGIKELQTVTVQGTAERDDAGNLTILATKMYVQ